MTTTPIKLILNKLPHARTNGSGWSAQCPAHDDQHPSLSIAEGDDGRVLLKCHAGCTTEEIVEKLDLNISDLFPPKLRSQRRHIVHGYDYRDEDGGLLYQVTRYEPKGFRQRRPKEGGWIWNMKDVQRVLYRLPELRAADPKEPVFVTEGEKDADRLADLGLVATTNVGGAGKWRTEYTEELQDRVLVLLEDNDAAGHGHVQKIAPVRPWARSRYQDPETALPA